MNDHEILSRLTGIETKLVFLSEDLKLLHTETNDRRTAIDDRLAVNSRDIEKLRHSINLINWVVAIVAGVAVATFTSKVINLLNSPIHSIPSEVRAKWYGRFMADVSLCHFYP